MSAFVPPKRDGGMKQKTYQTMMDMLDDRALETLDAPESLLAAFGLLTMTIAGLGTELAKRDAEQDAERIFEALVVISTTALLAASEHVLPELEPVEEEE